MDFLVDPAVSRAKFSREIEDYRKLEEQHRRRGWWLMNSEYPEVFVIFGAPIANIGVIPFGALLDFTNYDLWAPSVRLVNPFTRQPLKYKELPTRLRREVPAISPQGQAARQGVLPARVEDLMAAHHPDDIPFLCIAGVREYHNHPAHSGDSWLLHRGCGEGSLYFLLNVIYLYGVKNIVAEPVVRGPGIQIHSFRQVAR